MRLFLLSLFCLFSALCFSQGQEIEETDSNCIVHTKPVSLKVLINNSTTIFVGTVTKIELTQEKLKEKINDEEEEFELDVYVFTFRVETALKGEIKTGEEFKVRQSIMYCSPVKKGEKLLWFLPEVNELGFSVPLRYDAGHFRVFEDPKDKRFYATSLNGNYLLWEKSLFESEEEKKWFLDYLYYVYAREHGNAILHRLHDIALLEAPPEQLLLEFLLVFIDFKLNFEPSKKRAIQVAFEEILKISEPKSLSREEMLEAITENKRIQRVSITATPLSRQNNFIESWSGEIKIPEKFDKFWLLFLDDHFTANWLHECRYVLVAYETTSNFYEVISETSPPNTGGMEIEEVAIFLAE